MTNPTNPPAFPSNIPEREIQGFRHPGKINEGLTMRDCFAGNIIGHLYIAAKDIVDVSRSDIVAEAYKYADEMLIQRQKEGK